MPSEKEILRRALERLGRVRPEALGASRQRVRKNLNRESRTAPLPPPDAAPADLSVLRRPFYIAGGMALAGVLIVGGVAVRGRTETAQVTARQAAPSLPAKSAPVQTTESPAPVPAPQSPAPRKGTARQPTRAAKQAQAPDSPAVQSPRAQVRFALLPPGAGKVILDRACDACHRAASVGAFHYATRAQYAAVVSRMIAMGAQVSEQEAPVLTDYLFDNLAAKPERQAASAGQAILERACTGCHNLNGIENYSYDSEDAYRELVSTMVSYGATLSEAEKATLIRYLFTTYGKR